MFCQTRTHLHTRNLPKFPPELKLTQRAEPLSPEKLLREVHLGTHEPGREGHQTDFLLMLLLVFQM